MDDNTKHARKPGIGSKVLAGGGAALASGMALAQDAGLDTAAIDAAISDAQTKGLAIAGSVTLMLFLFAAAKYIRRAK